MLLAQTTRPSAEAMWNIVWRSLTATTEETTWRGWLGLFAGILAGFVIGFLVRKIILIFHDRWEKRHHVARAAVMEAIASPVSWLILVVGVSVGLGGVAMVDGARFFVGRVLALAYIIVLGWLVYNLIDVIDLLLRRIASHTVNNLDDQMVPLVRKALRLFLIIVLALFTLNNVFNRDVSAWLAGLGIAGLAITFAAQDTIKNFFGSLTILFDRPFQLGDTVILDTHEGTIEDIGFRSIRLRREDGVLVTIPNAKVVDQSIQNFSRRRTIRRSFEIKLAGDTPYEKIERALNSIRRVLAEPSVSTLLDDKSGPPSVTLDDSTSRTIRIFYWFNSADAITYHAHAEHVSLSIYRELASQQIQVL